MLQPGPAKKVTIYINEDQQYHGRALYSAILDFLFYRSVSGATVTRGIAGFGADHHLHTTRVLDLSDKMPVKIEFLEDAIKVQDLLPKLGEMVGTGLIEIHDTAVAKSPSVAKADTGSTTPKGHLKIEGKAKLMRIYVGESDRWKDKPLYQGLVEALRSNDIAGVTVYKGILGYGANRRLHKDSTLHLSHDAPVMLSIVDTEEKLQSVFPVLDEMVQQGLVVLSDVDIIKYTPKLEQLNTESK